MSFRALRSLALKDLKLFFGDRRALLAWVRGAAATTRMRESALLLWGDGLFAQEHHLMAQHRVIQLFKLVVAQRAADIDTRHLRANIRPQRNNA